MDQVLDGVAMRNARDVLFDDGAVVENFRDVMSGRADQLDAALERLMVRLCANERGQKSNDGC